MNRKVKRIEQIFNIITSIRSATGMSAKSVIDFVKRRGHFPLTQRSNYVRFVNESVVLNFHK